MRECLKCKKDISGKHESAKFCSTSCRVMWNRNPANKKEKGLTELQQMKVLYNALMEKIDKLDTYKIEYINPHTSQENVSLLNAENKNQFTAISEVPKRQIKRTPAHWVELRRECETADDYAKWLEDLENSGLPTREKNLIKQTI